MGQLLYTVLGSIILSQISWLPPSPDLMMCFFFVCKERWS